MLDQDCFGEVNVTLEVDGAAFLLIDEKSIKLPAKVGRALGE